MKLKKILVSQPKPESERSPWLELPSKHKVDLDFKAFIHVEGLTSSDFRKQKIDITQFGCVILNSRNAVDHYFRMANELRFTVPEKTKYFCMTEAVALYLQKYIQYRKRKIFFAQQGLAELAEPIRKNKDEKFLYVCSDRASDKYTRYLDEVGVNYSRATFYKTVYSDMSDMNIPSYDVIVFFSPNGVNSLFDNYPKYKQGNTKIAVFGSTTLATAQSKGLKVDLAAPLPEAPSMTMALSLYINKFNSKGGPIEPMIPVFATEKSDSNGKDDEESETESSKKITVKKKKSPAKPATKAQKKTARKPAAKKTTAKKPASRKPAAKKTTTKKKTVRKPVTKKATTKKKVTRKPAAKKTTTRKKNTRKPVVKKRVTRKPATKKATTRKTTAKKKTTRKTTAKKKTVKKATTRKSTTKKTTARKPAAKKTTTKKKPTTRKTAAKKPVKRKTSTRKTATKKSSAKRKSTAKKTAPKRKATSKKTTKKSTARKPTTKKRVTKKPTTRKSSTKTAKKKPATKKTAPKKRRR